MNNKGLLVPGALAVGAALLYVGVLTSRERTLMSAYEPTEVLVARADIPERTLLTPEMVEHVAIPRKFVMQDAYEYRTQSDAKLIDNLVTQVRIPKGNQIQQSTLVPVSAKAGLSTKVPPGYRGAVLPVDAELMALIRPGDFVDVLLTFDALMHDNRREKVTVTLLQALLVIGVGRDLGQGLRAEDARMREEQTLQAAAMSEKGAISVAVNPRELQYLALAHKTGDVTVGLRGIGDRELHVSEMSSLSRLFR